MLAARRVLPLGVLLLGAACAAEPLPRAPAPVPPPVCPPPPAAPVAPPAGAAAFDPGPWLEDFAALRAELSSHYANLEWAVRDRHMDLPALRAETEGRLREARTEAQAQRAVRRFLEAFGDGHLEVDFAAPGRGAGGGRPLCARLGYDKRTRPGVDFARVGAYAPLLDADATDVPGGVLRLPGHKPVGVLRIGLFMEQAHPALCETARASLGLADDFACDDECEEKLEGAVSELLTRALERRAASLQRAGVSAVIVDVTGNGGGTNWVEPAARVLTKIPLRSPRLGFVRHEHWVHQLRERLKAVTDDRARAGDVPGGKLEAAIAALKGAAEQAAAPCDRAALWEKDGAAPSCSLLVTSPLFTSGVLPYAKPDAFAGRPSAWALFSPSHYRYEEGTLSAPLVVLTDGDTSSAAEYFVAILRDNGAAVVAGAPTLGAGCGFTNGGIPAVLPRSGARVRIPDCARLRADGRNEVEGEVPDALWPLLDRDSAAQRADKVRAGLEHDWARLAQSAERGRR